MFIFGGDRHLMAFNDLYFFDLEKGVKSLQLYHHDKWQSFKLFPSYDITIIFIMKWLTNILAKLSHPLRNTILKLSRITQASLAIAIVLLCRKLLLLRGATSTAEAKVILENISSFYNKLRNSQIKSVSILANSISYTDLQQNIFQAVLPKHAQGAL